MRVTHQRGFTLLEIMIALTIGLFLLAALLTIVQSNKAVFLNHNQLEQMQDGERMALTLMADVVQSASYFPDPTTNSLASTLVAGGSFLNSQAITGVSNASTAGDSISVRYMTAPQDGILNCSGTFNPNPVNGANILYVNQFAVGTGALSGQLVCTVTAATVGIVGTVVTPYTLVSGVTNLSVLYGVKTNLGAPGNNVDTYLNASQMTAANWQSVISVLIKLTFTNPLYKGAGLGQPQFIVVQRVVDLMNQTGPVT
jgi:type IV pilus assembly protein PilW